jgi:hypothetical protein
MYLLIAEYSRSYEMTSRPEIRPLKIYVAVTEFLSRNSLWCSHNQQVAVCVPVDYSLTEVWAENRAEQVRSLHTTCSAQCDNNM